MCVLKWHRFAGKVLDNWILTWSQGYQRKASILWHHLGNSSSCIQFLSWKSEFLESEKKISWTRKLLVMEFSVGLPSISNAQKIERIHYVIWFTPQYVIWGAIFSDYKVHEWKNTWMYLKHLLCLAESNWFFLQYFKIIKYFENIFMENVANVKYFTKIVLPNF